MCCARWCSSWPSGSWRSTSRGAVATAIGLDKALQAFEGLGVPADTAVRLSSGPQGVYGALRFAEDVRKWMRSHRPSGSNVSACRPLSAQRIHCDSERCRSGDAVPVAMPAVPACRRTMRTGEQWAAISPSHERVAWLASRECDAVFETPSIPRRSQAGVQLHPAPGAHKGNPSPCLSASRQGPPARQPCRGAAAPALPVQWRRRGRHVGCAGRGRCSRRLGRSAWSRPSCCRTRRGCRWPGRETPTAPNLN